MITYKIERQNGTVLVKSENSEETMSLLQFKEYLARLRKELEVTHAN